MKNIYYIVSIILFITHVYPQYMKIDKIEPPNWWVGMKTNQIQLMLYGENLKNIKAEINTDNIKIRKVHKIENDSYSLIDINILEDCSAGNYTFTLKNNRNSLSFSYPIYERDSRSNKHQGFGPQDIIYLITPDRFANGDLSNDNISGMRDHTDRRDILRRHGGDIQGIINKLTYIKDLGFTTIWINPLIENDMDISYHGYAATDLYKIDPRFGTNELYKQLVDKAHSMGLKIIMDHVSNHVGMYHPWVENPPTETWFHGNMDNHVYARHDKSVLIDPYIDSSLYKNMKEGWFVREMPDLDQSELYLKNYLVQNTIWWIESFGIDGIREDTYPYVNQQFLSDWAKMIFIEYPNFNIVGEVWINDPVFLAPFQKNSSVAIDVKTYLPSLTDFGLFEAFGDVLNRNESINTVYQTLSQDYLYSDPNNLVTFLDNHDVMRLWDLVSGDMDKYKMALVMLFTMRGIPQIYYGTEIGLHGGNDHGLIRRDFPGGFIDELDNNLEPKNIISRPEEFLVLIKDLIKLRKENSAFTLGEFTHYPPENEIYIYFRQYANEKCLVLLNNNNRKMSFDLNQIKLINENYSNFDVILKNELTKIKKKQHVELDKYGYAILKITQE